jgi:hypothetical protein
MNALVVVRSTCSRAAWARPGAGEERVRDVALLTAGGRAESLVLGSLMRPRARELSYRTASRSRGRMLSTIDFMRVIASME